MTDLEAIRERHADRYSKFADPLSAILHDFAEMLDIYDEQVAEIERLAAALREGRELIASTQAVLGEIRRQAEAAGDPS